MYTTKPMMLMCMYIVFVQHYIEHCRLSIFIEHISTVHLLSNLHYNKSLLWEHVCNSDYDNICM